MVVWGHPDYGGDSKAVVQQLRSGVTSLRGNGYAFAALREDLSVITWGNRDRGGDASSVAMQLADGVAAVYVNQRAFAALKLGGAVVSWGHPSFGGDSSAVASQLLAGIVDIHSNPHAFAALKKDGAVVTWGDRYLGGDSSIVAGRLATDVVAVQGNRSAFAALRRTRLPKMAISAEVPPTQSYGAQSTEEGNRRTALYGEDLSFAASRDDESCVAFSDPCTGQSALTRTQRHPARTSMAFGRVFRPTRTSKFESR